MRAEMEDAPWRVGRRKNNYFIWPVALVVSMLVIGGGLYWAMLQAEKAEQQRVAQAMLERQKEIKKKQRLAQIELAQRLQQEKNQKNQSGLANEHKARNPINIYSPPKINNGEGYRAKAKRRSPSLRRNAAEWIESWGGGTQYLAEWVLINNHIESSSVCKNHKKGSIDYRECRKAAKQHYSKRCKIWSAKYDSDRSGSSDRMRVRYCVAARSFNPLG